MSNILVTPECRVVYVNVFKAVNSKNYPLKYKKKLTVLFAKNNTEHMEFVRFYLAAVKADAETFAKLHGQQPSMQACQLIDGDIPQREGKNAGKVDDNSAGHFCLIPWADEKSSVPVGVVDGNAWLAGTVETFYSGCWAKVSMQVFAFKNGSNKGLSLSLIAAAKVRDDTRLGGRLSDADALATLGVRLDGKTGMTLGEHPAASAHAGVMYPEITDPAARAALGI